MKYLIIFLLMISFVSAVEVDFDCPSKVFVGDEFECSLDLSGGEGIYDVKFEIQKDGKDVARILNGESWQSAYYYLKEFISSGETKDVDLIVDEDGDYEGILKIRQGDSREFFDFEIVVGENGGDFETEPLVEGGDGEDLVSESFIERESQEGIILNEAENEQKENFEVVYESKDSRVVEFLPFAFIIFLIIFIFILFWERF